MHVRYDYEDPCNFLRFHVISAYRVSLANKIVHASTNCYECRCYYNAVIFSNYNYKCSAAADMNRKDGGLLCPSRGSGKLGPHLTQCGLGRGRSTSVPSGIVIHPAVWPQQTWAENWGLCPFEGRGAGYPHNTMWPASRLTSKPSDMLIHPATTDMGRKWGVRCPFWGSWVPI